MASELTVISHSVDETLALAARLTPGFRPGDLIVLSGELGSGKTEFVRGLAMALGHDPELVNSPTYTIVNEYPGARPLYHLDLYRLDGPQDLEEVGWDDYLVREGLIVVEWGERAGERLPPQYYRISLKILDDSRREIRVGVVSK